MRLLFQRHLPGAAGMSDDDVPRPGRGKGVGAEPPSEVHLQELPAPADSALPGSQRYAVMRAAEMHQLKDGSHGKASNPDFGKTIRDLPL